MNYQIYQLMQCKQWEVHTAPTWPQIPTISETCNCIKNGIISGH